MICSPCAHIAQAVSPPFRKKNRACGAFRNTKIAPAAHFRKGGFTFSERARRAAYRLELVPKAPRRRRRVEVAAEGRYFTCFDARSHARNLEII
jgi:hypothetical protein